MMELVLCELPHLRELIVLQCDLPAGGKMQEPMTAPGQLLLAIRGTLLVRIAAWQSHSSSVRCKDYPSRCSKTSRASSVPSRTPPPLDCSQSSLSTASTHDEEDTVELQQDKHQVTDLANVIA